jgi:8-oxo-dGTP diphosphatase
MKQTTLCYIEKDDNVLMLYRNKKEIDINKGKWIGVGGHVEKNETIDECLIREVKEETGLSLLEYKLCGKIIFHIDNIIEECYLYKGLSFTGDLIDCSEGELKWIPKNQILDLNLWEGDYLFLNRMYNDNNYFEMELIYINDKLISYSIKEE